MYNGVLKAVPALLVPLTVLNLRRRQLQERFLTTSKGSEISAAEAFDIPSLFCDVLYTETSGYFEASETRTDQDELESYNTAFRFLIKRPDSSSPQRHHTPYTWHELGFWTSWTPNGNSLLLCFSNTLELRSLVADHLISQPSQNSTSSPISGHTVSITTPFAMHAYILSRITPCFDKAVWSWRDHIRNVENCRPTPVRPKPTEHFYNHVHELARHTTHSTEVLTTAANVVASMIDEATQASTDANTSASSIRHAVRTLKWQKSVLQCLQERSRSLGLRLQSEIDLAFQVQSQHDSIIAAQISEASQRDSTAMRTISVLGLVFLPGTYISAIFSMSFFNFQPSNGSTPQHWSVSNKFWLYWVVTIPVTAFTIVCWFYWQRKAAKKNPSSPSESLKMVIVPQQYRDGRVHQDV